ncbi:MAG: sulfatase-like hydrolase/transferase [Planctomycetota bacterium]
MNRSPARAGLWLSLALLGSLAACSDPKPKRLLLITLDTTRADRLGCYGKDDAGTPNLDALAKRGALFERAFAHVPSTLPSHASILTGSYPPRHGARENGLYRLTPASETLAEVLSSRGYRTGAVFAARPLDPRFGLDQGFESYEGPGTGGGHQFEWRADQVTQRALKWLERHQDDESTFLWVHYFDPHKTYAPPSEYQARHPSDPYQGEIAYTDAQIGVLLAGLERLGMLEDTIVAVTADHGESLGEHGESTHSIFVYDATLHVPLILAGPTLPEGRRVPELVRTVDIVPTLLEALDQSDPAPSQRDGVSLLTRVRDGGRLRLSSYCESMSPRLRYGWCDLLGLRTDTMLYVNAPRPELYFDESDPAKTDNRFDEATPEEVAVWNRTLKKIAFERLPGDESTRAQVTQDVLADLKQLGYVEASLSAGQEDPEIWWSTRLELDDPKDRIEAAELLYEGLELQQAGRNGEAIAAFERATGLDPRNATAWLNLAGAHLQARDVEAAGAAFEEAVSVDPDFSRAHYQLAVFLLDEKRETEAGLRHLLEAVRCDPGFAEAMSRLARLHEQSDDLEEAGHWIAKAVAADPASLDLLRDQARIAGALEDWSVARTALRKILEIEPSDIEAQRQLRSLPEGKAQ